MWLRTAATFKTARIRVPDPIEKEAEPVFSPRATRSKNQDKYMELITFSAFRTLISQESRKIGVDALTSTWGITYRKGHHFIL